MSVKFYTEQDNGTLKFQEEVEGTEDIGAAAEALFEARPRLAQSNEEFVVIVAPNDSLEEGTVSILRKQEVTQTAWVASSGEVTGDEDEEPEEEEPEPAKSARKPTSRRKAPARKPARKAAAKKPASRSKAKAAPKRSTKSAPKRGGAKKTPFTKSAKGDD